MAALLKSSCLLTVLVIGFTDFVIEPITTYAPIGICIALLVYIAAHVLRIRPPPLYAVEAVVGEDLCSENEERDNSKLVLRMVAHRGAGLDAVENTLEAFQMCADKGCKAIEFDINISKDGVPILFHDNNLERLTNVDKRISQTSYEELLSYDLSIKHPLKERFAPIYISKLECAVRQMLSNRQKMFIDIKNYDFKMVKVVLELFESFPELYGNAIVTSFFPHLIYAIRRRNPKILGALAWRPHFFAYDSYSGYTGPLNKRCKNIIYHTALCALDLLYEFLLPRFVYHLVGISIILLHKDTISPRTVREWGEKGVRVFAWTVNNPTEKHFMTKVLRITYLTDTFVGENFDKSSVPNISQIKDF